MMNRSRGFKRFTAIVLAIVFIFSSVVISRPEKTVQASGGKLVAFTFDDGPGSYGTTSRLLDGLAARGAKATFFMNGTNGPHGAAVNMSLLYRMVNDGHQLANHTNSHYVPFSSLSSDQMVNEKNAVDNYIYSAMGGWCQTIVRIPGGDTSSRISTSIDAPMIRWSVDPLDWQYRNANTVYNNIMSSVGDGSVVLVHDIYDSSVDGALRAISDLQSMGYECVTVSELFRRRGITLENGVTYGSAGITGVNRPGYSAPTAVKTFDNYANVKVKINNPNEWTTLRYTTDGSTPNLGSPVWDESRIVPENTTITVAGFDKFGTRTPVASISAPKEGYYGTFDATFYANRYVDLRDAFGYDAEALYNHYIKYGIKEGRQGSAIFCLKDYKERYVDLRNSFGNDYEKYLRHFTKYGMKEGRSGVKNFDVNSYKNRYVDLRRSFGDRKSVV
jgi:Predicted xylanase/chitin deacetylase